MSNTSIVGIVYLIQPAELVGTNRFKIGCSAKNTIDRCIDGYRKGTRCIYIVECVNPFGVEKLLKTSFNSKFTLVGGKEYFEGDETTIKILFKEIVFSKSTNNKTQIILDIPKEELDTCSSSEDETNEEDSSDEISKDIQPEEEPVVEITTYADYIKYSRVTDIIITNKKYVHGYIKLDGNIYYKFIDHLDPKQYQKDMYLFNGQSYTYKEIRKMIPYIIEINDSKTKYYTVNRDYQYIGYDNIGSLNYIDPLYNTFKRTYLFNDNTKPWESTELFNDYIKKYIQVTKNMIKLNESVDINENSNITHINGINEGLGSLKEWLIQNEDSDEVLYDYNKIVADIQKTCYSKDPELYIPKYNEYILNTYTARTCVLLDTHTFKTMNIDNRIILNKDTGNSIINTSIIDSIDTSIIDNLMNAYVTDKTHILNFKKLCKSIFIQSSTIPIVFNDPSSKQYSLSDMVDQILCTLNLAEKTLDFFSGFKDKDLRSHIKINGVPRLLRIYDIESQQNISKFTNLGITNIVKVNILQFVEKIYSIKNYNKWCDMNKDIIDKHCSKPPIDYNIDELLYKQSNLFWHFFKWCCAD